MSKEWSNTKKWNPFNSNKLLSQVYRWRKIQRGNGIPQPALVTIDPINICDQKCVWCNADFILKRNTNMLSTPIMLNIADFLKSWKGNDDWEAGVEAVCIAGGGEPLLNPGVGKLIDRLVENGIEVGVVTNGTNIDKFIEPLSKCTWVGVSVDAGTNETFIKLKKCDNFYKITKNIKKLIDYSKENNTALAKDGQGNGVSFKYLIHPDNVGEILEAAIIAKNIGCRNMHMRPVGVAWDKVGEHALTFTMDDIDTYKSQVEYARQIETDNFGVFGITHKFDNKFEKSNKFEKCHAIFMTAVFMPSLKDDKDAFNFGLCCDRRGDDLLTIGKELKDANDIKNLWGSDEHWKIFDKIKVGTCPRCTYQPHNQIFEHVIKKDNMTYKFI